MVKSFFNDLRKFINDLRNVARVFTQPGKEADLWKPAQSPPPYQTVRKLLASRRPWKNDLHSFDMARFLWRRGVREPFFRSSKMPFRSFRTACHVGGYQITRRRSILE